MNIKITDKALERFKKDRQYDIKGCLVIIDENVAFIHNVRLLN